MFRNNENNQIQEDSFFINNKIQSNIFIKIYINKNIIVREIKDLINSLTKTSKYYFIYYKPNDFKVMNNLTNYEYFNKFKLYLILKIPSYKIFKKKIHKIFHKNKNIFLIKILFFNKLTQILINTINKIKNKKNIFHYSSNINQKKLNEIYSQK